MIEDRRPRPPLVALTVLGVLAVVVAILCVLKAVGAGDGRTMSGSPRTVVATVGPNTPRAAPQANSVGAEIPVRVGTAAPAAQPALDLRQIVYTVAGNQRPDDPVTVVYADETGALRTVENVTLPWTMTLVPSLPVNYVYASSRGSQLNCWISDAAGGTVVSQTEYTPTTTCNR